MNLLESLQHYQTICAHVRVQTWQDALRAAVQPLVDRQLVLPAYYEAIITNTERHGPYYIISETCAIPHAEAGSLVRADCFSLVTLANPVYFPNDARPVRVLLGFGATTGAIHTGQVLPQIVALLEDPVVVAKMIEASSASEIWSIIQTVDVLKYVSKG